MERAPPGCAFVMFQCSGRHKPCRPVLENDTTGGLQHRPPVPAGRARDPRSSSGPSSEWHPWMALIPDGRMLPGIAAARRAGAGAGAASSTLELVSIGPPGKAWKWACFCRVFAVTWLRSWPELLPVVRRATTGCVDRVFDDVRPAGTPRLLHQGAPCQAAAQSRSGAAATPPS